MRELWPHQKVAVEAFFKKGVRLFGYDIGLGKTMIPLEIFRRLKAEHPDRKMLVICPVNAMHTWQNEAAHYDFSMMFYLKPATQIPIDISVMSYERFRVTDFDWKMYDVVVFDELHKVKNPRAKVTKKAVKSFATVPYKIGLSGTTIVKYHEIYTQVAALVSDWWHQYGITCYTNFIREFFVCHPTNFYPMYPRAGSKQAILEMVKPIMLTCERKDAGVGLQEIIEKFNVKIPAKKDIIDLGDFTRTLIMTGGYNQELKCFSNREKIEYLFSKIEEHDKPVIIFCRYLHEVDEIVKKLGNKTYRIVGNDKRELEDAINKGGKHITATYCISEGINLQYHYDTIFYYSIPLSYRTLLQSKGRVDRSGQKNQVVIYYLLSGWIDERIFSLISNGKDALEMFKRYGKI